jgi:SAM-dependent methyltransferase
MMEQDNPFELWADDYDSWFERHPDLFNQQQSAISEYALGTPGCTLEVGCGSGRFAQVLSVSCGIDPSPRLCRLAYRRGVSVICARGEDLPFRSDSFTQIFLITVLCIVSNPLPLLIEIWRVLKPGSSFILVELDPESQIGQGYVQKQSSSRFLSHARLYTRQDLERSLAMQQFTVHDVRRQSGLILFACRK